MVSAEKGADALSHFVRTSHYDNPMMSSHVTRLRTCNDAMVIKLPKLEGLWLLLPFASQQPTPSKQRIKVQ